MNLLCLNPYHYEVVMELNLFAEKMTNLVTGSYGGPLSKMDTNTLMMWARDIHKFIEWSPNCSPQKEWGYTY